MIFIVWIDFIILQPKTNLNHVKNYVKIKVFVMLDVFWRHKKGSFIIKAYLQCLIEKINECKNNPENSSTTKLGEHIPSIFSMPTIS